MRLKQTIALVTGGASGIGRAIVERFVEEGARVVIGDIDAAAGRALADRLGNAVRFATLDISRAAQWAEALRITEAAFGPLNCLVNNAGVSVAGTITSTTEAVWRRTLDVNATGTFLGCQQALAVMADKAGTIINVASARGQRPSSAQLAYSASKALVLSLTEGIALHCGERGLPIRCNAICPGVVDTPILDEARSLMGGREAADALFAGMHLLGRIGRPEEVAAAAAFLASDEASFITGATLGVDGGFRIRDR